MTDVTRILELIQNGDSSATDRLLPIVYKELRRLAAQRLENEKPGQTLQATALVHEAYLRLVESDSKNSWDNRGHFFSAAAEAMRRILVEKARQKRSLKRGGTRQRIDLDPNQMYEAKVDVEVLRVNEALDALALEYPELAKLVELKYFGGLGLEEAADCLQISVRTAHRKWAYAKAWLRKALGEKEQ